MARRTFIKLAGVGAAALSSGDAPLAAIAGPFSKQDLADHYVPADKKLRSDWLHMLTARGNRTVYRGRDLETIGMPVGGLGAGQLYITGDGRLAHWDIFNWKTPGYGYASEPKEPLEAVEQGFALRVRQSGATLVRRLDSSGFADVSFCGEYPLAQVEYRDRQCPLRVTLAAFSPFIPLNADDSALPATVLQFTLENTSDEAVDATLAGWLQNAVCHHSGGAYAGDLVNQVVKTAAASMVLSSARPSTRPVQERPTIELATFEADDYGDWKVEGKAFGQAPAKGTLAGQQKVAGFQGKGLVNTFLGGDAPQGKATSPSFTINRSFIRFLVGGGQTAGQTCINLLVDGKVVRTATGAAREQLVWHNWNVQDLAGKEARIEIVDRASGGWGHINVDQIELADRAKVPDAGPLEAQRDFGTMALAVLADPSAAQVRPALPAGPLPQALFADDAPATAGLATVPLGARLCGSVGQSLKLQPGQTRQVTFLVAWCFPHRLPGGHYYATRFDDAAAVVRYVAAHCDRLADETRLWHDTYYDSTLPYWLLDRIHSTVSTLATSTCQVWENGRFWAYEGVRCCHGTCGHVWNYEHALARLFPRWERSVRELQDFNPAAGFVEKTGMIRFRGDVPDFWCGDAQTGYILKALREHQASADDAFLKRNWPHIRKALEYLFRQDGNDDGVIEGQQHNTYDINFFGPNPMIGTLYLGALRAGEEMAREMGDEQLAARCRRVYESGRKFCTDKLFNGEYYVQLVDLERHPKHQYGDGCLSDQLFGQGWAHQVDLGHILPLENVRKTLESIWKYNWAPDIAPQNKAHPPQRWFAYAGEAGLFTCTWPKSKHLGPESVLYRDEVWTGIEYQVAGHMAWEGMITEALAICRAVHERYHPAKHNPWNEIECGDHYARGMASWSVLIGLSGFSYHGPKQRLGFAPRINQDAFQAAFTAAEGWGSLVQKRRAGTQTNRIDVRWGKLPLQVLAFELAPGQRVRQCRVTAAGSDVDATAKQSGAGVVVTLARPVIVEKGQSLEVTLTC